MTTDKLWKLGILVFLPLIIVFLIPTPEVTVNAEQMKALALKPDTLGMMQMTVEQIAAQGLDASKEWFVFKLTNKAWIAFAIYLSAILGLVLKPFPEPVILLTAVGATALFVNDASGALRGVFVNNDLAGVCCICFEYSFCGDGVGAKDCLSPD